MTGSIVLNQRFKSIEELEQAIAQYGKEQNVPYILRNSTLAETYNKNNAHRPMPMSKVFKDRKYVCKHFGAPRQSKHKDGTKKRGNQSTFKKYCGAKINVNYKISDDCYEISQLEETHSNHKPEKKHAKHYPEFRQVKSKEVIGTVETLFQNEAKPHRIRDVVLNSGVLATRQDIQNMRNRWLATFEKKNGSTEDAVFEQLRKLKEDDPNSVVVVHFDEISKVIQSIFFQTSFMRESLELFPELLIKDTTYKLCENEMPLVVFEVVDCFGAGRIAGYALVFSENKEAVTAALEVLKLSSKNLVDQVQVVYVDKSQAELISIKTVLPSTEIHLCDFHVKDTFSKQPVKSKVAKNDWEAVDKLLKRLIHAHTKEIYDSTYQELKIAAGGDSSEFMIYFNKYWHTEHVDLVWSDYQRNESFTLGERTTGRVESHNAKIKIMISKKLPVAEVILRLCVLNRNQNIEHSQRVFNEMSKSKYHKYSSDPVEQQILKVNTPFVGSFLRAQYLRSLEPPSASIHITTMESCDCKYFKQSKLICSHIFRARRENGVQVYDHELVPSRWTVIIPTQEQTNFQQFEIIASPVKTSKRKKAMTQEERFNFADCIAKRICSYIANFGGDDFFSRIVQLQNFQDLMRMGKRVAVVGVNGEGEPDLQSIQSKDPTTEVQGNEDPSKATDENGNNECLENQPAQEIFIAQVQGGTYSVLTEAQRNLLTLPQKCPVPGRPKGKRGARKKKSPTREEEIDEPTAGKDSQCHFCKGPVTILTSCSKPNQGKKYIVCENNETENCLTFHRWIDMDGIDGTNAIASQPFGPSQPINSQDANPSQLIDSPDKDPPQQINSTDANPSQHIDSPDASFNSHAPASPLHPNKICHSCRKPAIIVTAQTATNFGRRYYTCADRNTEQGCRWINWIDKKTVPTVSPVKKTKIATSVKHKKNSPSKQKIISPVKQTKMTSFLAGAKDANNLGNLTLSFLDLDDCDLFNVAANVAMDSTHTSSLEDNADVKPVLPFKPSSRSAEPEIIEISDDSESENELQSCSSQLDQERLDIICIICAKRLGSEAATCASCLTIVHMDCSVISPSNEKSRLCTNCFCLLCKGVGGRNHVCECFICKFPLIDGIICYRCERLCHDLECSEKVIAEEKDNAERYICQFCSHTLRRGVPIEAWNDLVNNEMLTDHHVARASAMLRKIFSSEIDGLCDPLAVTYGSAVENIHHYPPKRTNKDYVQIMYTGSNHWVTTIFKKGLASVIILDSLQSEGVSGHVAIQIGMISQTAGVITVVRPPVQEQSNSTDCCLYAIAYATDYCYEKMTQFIEYDEDKFRDHWKSCLTSGKITPFPRLSKRPKKSKRQDDISFIRINCCVCLLPDNYGDMISCDKCDEWFHKICVEVDSNFNDNDDWFCVSCSSLD